MTLLSREKRNLRNCRGAVPDDPGSLLAMRKAVEKGWPLHRAEREVIGYHAVGGELLRQWSLPESVWETTMFHNEPYQTDRYRSETALVHLGVLLTRAANGEGVFNEGLLIVEPLHGCGKRQGKVNMTTIQAAIQ